MGSLDHIPGSLGPPFLGNTIPFLFDTRGMVLRMQRQYGDVFKSREIGQTSVTFLSPEATKQIYLDADNVLSSQIGWDHALGRLFRGGLMLRDFDDHRIHRLAMAHAFRRAALQAYAIKVHEVVERHMVNVAPGPLDVYALSKRLTLDIAAEVFVGVTLDEDIETVNDCFVDIMRATMAPVRRPIPGLPFHRGLRARARLAALFTDLVQDRRARPEATDLLSRLSHAETDGGAGLETDEVVDHMIFILLAAHDTTAASLAVMLWELARHPRWQGEVADEVRALGGAPVTLDNQRSLVVTERVFKESLRMSPPVPYSARGVLADTEIDGWAVPAGTVVATCSLGIHRHPDYWSEPDVFDPDRFAPGREEDKQHSHLFIPFGGGAHLCLGNHFAEMVAKAVTAAVLQRFTLEQAPRRELVMRSVPIPKPRDPMVLVVR